MSARRHCASLEPHRMVWFRPTDYSGQGETCQCEGTDRSECQIHGPSGAELYADAERANAWWTRRRG